MLLWSKRVEAQNIDKVKPKVQMQVSACPIRTTALKGTVRTVAPDAPAIGKQRGGSIRRTPL